MKKTIFLGSFLLFLHPIFTQTAKIVDLSECHQQAMANYPLQHKPALLDQTARIELEKLDTDRRRPVIFWNADASLQSEVVQFPFEFPGVDPIELPLYKVTSSLSSQYTLYDGGLTEARKNLEQTRLQTDRQSVTVELEKLKSQVNAYFFGVLLLREKKKILENSLANLQTRISALEGAVRQGAALEGEVDKIRVQALKMSSEIDQTAGEIRALTALLSGLTGITIDDAAEFRPPDLSAFSLDASIQRPELPWFDLQKNQILAREQLITASRQPQVSAFAQAGLGIPNPYNFFDETLSPFAIAGITFRWKVFDWKQAGRDRQLLTLQSQLIDNQRAVFEKNINLMDGKYEADLQTTQALIGRDEEILRLQQKILRQVSAQLDQGVITSTEYLDQVNAEIQAHLSLQTHLLQLQKIKVDYLTLKGRL